MFGKVALVTSGIGTLIYILCTRGKSPVYLGSSFAFIAPLIAAYAKGGISGNKKCKNDEWLNVFR